MMRIKE